MRPEELNPFLKETKYCNFNHPEIKNLAQEIVKPYVLEKEKVKAVFNWVKENIKFTFGYWGVDALYTLRKGRGMCTNKSNLLIALLRSLKIPAGYGILKVITSEFFSSLMCPFFKKLVSPQTSHIYTNIFLDGKWIRCDPSLDSELGKALKKKTPFSEFSGFDLRERELKKIKGILEKEEFLANIDEKLSKPPKNLRGKVLELLNQYLLFLRENKKILKNFLTADEIEEEFMKWLEDKSFSLFYFFNPIYENFKKQKNIG